jgi:hypothetical protein
MVVQAIQGEYRRYRVLAEAAMAQLDEEPLFRVLGEDGNSIAILVQHLGGNLKSRFSDFLTQDGEKTWRNRDGEFEPNTAQRAQLETLWREGWEVLESSLAALDDSQLKTPVFIRGQELSVIEALERSLAHVAYHVGQIVLLARWQKGASWTSLSIPRGNSAKYNSNPTRERPSS